LKNEFQKWFYLVFMLVTSIGIAQTDCSSIQCDCENIPDSEKDPSLLELCKYYEQSIIELCKSGEKNLNCHKNAKGPNAWQIMKNNVAVVKPTKVNPNPPSNIENIDHLLAEIRNSENSFTKYAELHSRLELLQKDVSGLELAMKMSDYFVEVHAANNQIEFAIKFNTFLKDYYDGVFDMPLAKLIEPIKDLGQLEIDQLDMKYELANIFKSLKDNGTDVQAIFGKDNYYYNEDVLRFISECYASNSSGTSRKQMQELRATSNRIFLRRIDNLIPLANKQSLTEPIWNINKGVLDWNEQLLDETLNALWIISENAKKKKIDAKAFEKGYSNFKQVYSKELWTSTKYDSYFNTVSNELPIVWELLEAVFLN
jgi:hypothetical protein